LLSAHELDGARTTINNPATIQKILVKPKQAGKKEGGLGEGNPATIQKILVKPKQAGKKEGGLGEGIFARLLCPPKASWGGWEAAVHSASVEEQSRKFFFLKGKIKKGGEAPKDEGKNFLLCSAVRRAPPLGGFCARQDADRRSKKVRASFSNCDQNFKT